MAIIDQDYVVNAVGAETEHRLTGGDDSVFDQFEAAARAEVQAAGEVAGYTIADNSTNAMVRKLVFAQFYVALATYRKGMDVPTLIARDFEKLAQVRDGNLPIPGLTPSTRDAVGGATFSDSGSNGRPTRFARSNLDCW